MPNYDYRCSECGYEEEMFQKMSDPSVDKCPKCQKDTFQRRPGGGSGLIFKGTGFYETDYKNPPSKCCPCDKPGCNQ